MVAMPGVPFDKGRGEEIMRSRSKEAANVIAFKEIVTERLQGARESGCGWLAAWSTCLEDAPEFDLSPNVATGILERVAAQMNLSPEEIWELLRSEAREIRGDPGAYLE